MIIYGVIKSEAHIDSHIYTVNDPAFLCKCVPYLDVGVSFTGPTCISTHCPLGNQHYGTAS